MTESTTSVTQISYAERAAKIIAAQNIKPVVLETTLKLLRAHGACESGYRKLRRPLGAGYGDRTPINLLKILESNGLDDFFWALRVVPKNQTAIRDSAARLMACDFAELVLHLFEEVRPDDLRPRNCIAVARRFAVGEASRHELAAAWAAASAAAWAADSAAASAAAWAAASAADSAAASDAARAAASATAWTSDADSDACSQLIVARLTNSETSVA